MATVDIDTVSNDQPSELRSKAEQLRELARQYDELADKEDEVNAQEDRMQEGTGTGFPGF